MLHVSFDNIFVSSRCPVKLKWRLGNSFSTPVEDLERLSPSGSISIKRVGCNWHIPVLPELNFFHGHRTLLHLRIFWFSQAGAMFPRRKTDVCDCCEHIPCHCVSTGYSTHCLGLFSAPCLHAALRWMFKGQANKDRPLIRRVWKPWPFAQTQQPFHKQSQHSPSNQWVSHFYRAIFLPAATKVAAHCPVAQSRLVRRQLLCLFFPLLIIRVCVSLIKAGRQLASW